MNIIILDNFFRQDYRYLPKFLKSFVFFYSKFRLFNLVNKLKKKYGQEVKIKIITNRFKRIENINGVQVESLSNIRINIDREEFIKLKNKVKRLTKENLIRFLNNLNNLKIFNFENIFIGKLIEFHTFRFFNRYLGLYELLNTIIRVENFKEIILFHYPKEFNHLILDLSKNTTKFKVFNNSLVEYGSRILNKLNIFNFLLTLYAVSIKNSIYKTQQDFQGLKSQKQFNILLIVNSKNQLRSVEPIHENLKISKDNNPIYYTDNDLISTSNFTRFIKYLIRVHRIWKTNKEKITHGIRYNSLTLNFLLNMYYNFELLFLLAKIFNNLKNFAQVVKRLLPSLAIISDEMKLEGRGYAAICKNLKIPSIYIPHAGAPIYDEMVCKRDFTFITVGGEKTVDYYLNKGESQNKIVVTGTPRYEFFYKGEIKGISEITDMFTNRKYVFNQNEVTILLTTSPIDDKANEKIISAVVSCLKELNLEENLVIKLHPSEDGILHRRILQKLNSNSIIVRDVNILELIKSCNLLFSGISTTILEAMIIGTPIILLDFINRDFDLTGRYLFTQEEFVKVAKNEESLIKIVTDLLRNTEIIKYSENLKHNSRQFSIYDDKEPPTKKIMKLIKGIIEANTL